EVEGGFGGFEKTRLLIPRERDAILRDEEVRRSGEWRWIREEIVDTMNAERLTVSGTRHREQRADVRLCLQILQDFRPGEICRLGDLETNDDRAVWIGRVRFGPDRLRIVVFDFLAGLGIE